MAIEERKEETAAEFRSQKDLEGSAHAMHGQLPGPGLSPAGWLAINTRRSRGT